MKRRHRLSRGAARRAESAPQNLAWSDAHDAQQQAFEEIEQWIGKFRVLAQHKLLGGGVELFLQFYHGQITEGAISDFNLDGDRLLRKRPGED